MHSQNVLMHLDGYQKNFAAAYVIDGYVSATTFTSAPVKIARKVGYSLTFSCPSTGTPAGTVKLQLCNDEERDTAGDTADTKLVNWADVTDATSPVSGASVIVFDHSSPTYRWMRLVYTRTSGSITATVRLHLKDYSGNQ